MICSQNLSARSTDNKKISLIEWDYSQFSGKKKTNYSLFYVPNKLVSIWNMVCRKHFAKYHIPAFKEL